jgi:hypothetical protein
MRDASPSKKQRHTGAGGFVRSSAVKNDFPVERQQSVFLCQILGIET